MAGLCGCLAVACAIAAAAPAPSETTRQCGPQGPATETLARTSEVRVYSFIGQGEQQAYACGPKLRRPVRVGPSKPGGRIWFARIRKPVAARDQWVAMVEGHTEGTDWGSTWLRVFGVRSRHLARCEISRWAQMNPTKVRKLFITQAGAVAWASTENREAPMLAVCERQSTVTILDEDAGLQIDTIKLNGSVLSWTDSAGGHRAVIK